VKIENEIIILQIKRVINKLLFLKKRKRFQLHGVSLYPSEIHVMIVLDETCASNATKIAQTLGVTKGAISQTLSRLEKKGILVKTKDPYHKNELELTFTELGGKALKYYKKQAAELFQQHVRYLSKLSQKEKLIIHRFMSQMEILVNDIG
jgi:DNA-binding MarR family transcriptional regulator